MKATTVANATTSAEPVVTGVDHLAIRVDDAHYDQLFSLLTDTFQLPLPPVGGVMLVAWSETMAHIPHDTIAETRPYCVWHQQR